MKASELRQLSAEDLMQKEKSLKKELFDLNVKKRLGGLEQTARIRSLRRDIARIFTVLRERELEKVAHGKETK